MDVSRGEHLGSFSEDPSRVSAAAPLRVLFGLPELVSLLSLASAMCEAVRWPVASSCLDTAWREFSRHITMTGVDERELQQLRAAMSSVTAAQAAPCFGYVYAAWTRYMSTAHVPVAV